MQIVKNAFKYFKKDFKDYIKSYFLFQTIAIINLFIFSHFVDNSNTFLRIHFDDYNIDSIEATFILIVMVIALGFYAYHYLLNTQNDKLAIFKLSGIKMSVIILYFLSYLFFIVFSSLILAIPLGILGLDVIYRFIFSSYGNTYPGFHFSSNIIAYFLVMLIFQVIYLVILTIGFIYRTEIKHLIYGATSLSVIKSRKKKQTILLNSLITLLGFFVLVYGFTNFEVTYGDLLFVGLVSIFLIVKRFISSILFWLIGQYKIRIASKYNNLFIGLTTLKTSLIKTNSIITILSFIVYFIFCNIYLSYQRPSDSVLNIAIYAFVTLILCITIGYQMLMNTNERKIDFEQLYNLGKTKKELLFILRFEVFVNILITLVLSLFIPSLLTLRLLLNKIISIDLVAGLYLFYLAILAITSIFVYKSYRKKVFE